MSISSVTELSKERRGKETLTGVTYIRVFDVLTDSVNDGPYAVRNATGIPLIGEEYPDDSAATLRSKDPIPFAEGRVNWHVVCEYASPSADDGMNRDRRTADPLEEDPRITFGQTQRIVAATLAYTGGDLRGYPSQSVQNSAEEDFDPPLEKEETSLLISIIRNEATFSAETAYTYKNTGNNSAITVAGVRIGEYEGRMLELNGTKMWDQNGEEYWEVRYEIEVNFRSQELKVLDRGFYTKDADKSEDADGDQMGVSKNLDGSGEFLAPGATPEYLDFNIYWKTEWASLRLPRGY